MVGELDKRYSFQQVVNKVSQTGDGGTFLLQEGELVQGEIDEFNQKLKETLPGHSFKLDIRSADPSYSFAVISILSAINPDGNISDFSGTVSSSRRSFPKKS